LLQQILWDKFQLHLKNLQINLIDLKSISVIKPLNTLHYTYWNRLPTAAATSLRAVSPVLPVVDLANAVCSSIAD
jgi:hypothetical protein